VTSRELGGQVQHLDQLVAAVVGRIVNDRDEIDSEPEPCRPNDPLDGVH
jgi:hypothetical protein